MIKEIHNTRYELLLKWLKTARLRQNMSVRDLAKLIDEPYQFVSKVETGQRRLNVYEYVQYCKALGVKSSDGLQLLEGEANIFE